MSEQKPREIAFRVLIEHREGAHFLEHLLERAFAKGPISPPDRGLAQELAFGVVRWEKTLDWLIDQKTRERPAKPALQILLRLGLYQLFWLDRIPDHAAVNETVDLAKRVGFKSQAGFINAVLRASLRERDTTRQKLADLRESDPALGLSHPEWLYQRWRERYGESETRRLMEWNNQPPPTFARINLLQIRGSRCEQALTEAWQSEGVQFEPRSFDWMPANTIFELLDHPPLATLKTFQEGWFYIQDPSTLLSVHELAPQPGETILDMCAAPGGKTTYIAALINNQGKIVATDISPSRLELIHQNIARLGVMCATIQDWSAVISQSPPASFDRILLDVPCSNTGVMRRRVELRRRIRPEELARLVKEQRDLLEHASQLVRPGGAIVYSTCSLEPEENTDVIQAFLATHPNFILACERILLPFRDNVDGAYAARLIRQSV